MPLFDLRQKKEGAIPCRSFLKLITLLAKETRPLHLKRKKFEKKLTRAFSLYPLFRNPLDGANGKTLVSVASKSPVPLRPEVEAGRELRFCSMPIGGRKGRPIATIISSKRHPFDTTGEGEKDTGGDVVSLATN